MVKGLITDISRASFHDGTGIRSTVFLKGCPLHCLWCHNPESISTQPQTLFYPEKCIGCGKCDEGCFAGARVRCGKEMSAEEVWQAVRLDKPYYQNGGGVTFSGGEPLMQPEFLRECIKLCREDGIGCAVETSLFLFDQDIFRSLDFVMADLKIWNSTIHKQYTGVENERILENFRRLDALNVPIYARTPVIPEIEQGIDRISDFLRGLKNVMRYDLLPYHTLGISKSRALGQEAREFTAPTKQQMEDLKRYAYVR